MKNSSRFFWLLVIICRLSWKTDVFFQWNNHLLLVMSQSARLGLGHHHSDPTRWELWFQPSGGPEAAADWTVWPSASAVPHSLHLAPHLGQVPPWCSVLVQNQTNQTLTPDHGGQLVPIYSKIWHWTINRSFIFCWDGNNESQALNLLWVQFRLKSML